MKKKSIILFFMISMLLFFGYKIAGYVWPIVQADKGQMSPISGKKSEDTINNTEDDTTHKNSDHIDTSQDQIIKNITTSLKQFDPDISVNSWEQFEVLENDSISVYVLSSDKKEQTDFLAICAESKDKVPHHYILLTSKDLWALYKDDIIRFFIDEYSGFQGTDEITIDQLLSPPRYTVEQEYHFCREQQCPEELKKQFYDAYGILRDLEIGSMLQENADIGEFININNSIYYMISRSEFDDMDSMRSYFGNHFTDEFIDILLDKDPPSVIEQQGRLFGLYSGEHPGDMTVGEIIPESICDDSSGDHYLKVKCKRYTAGGMRLNAYDEYHYFQIEKQGEKWLFNSLYIIGAI